MDTKLKDGLSKFNPAYNEEVSVQNLLKSGEGSLLLLIPYSSPISSLSGRVFI